MIGIIYPYTKSQSKFRDNIKESLMIEKGNMFSIRGFFLLGFDADGLVFRFNNERPILGDNPKSQFVVF